MSSHSKLLKSLKSLFEFFLTSTNSIPSTLRVPTGQTEYSESNLSPPPIPGKNPVTHPPVGTTVKLPVNSFGSRIQPRIPWVSYHCPPVPYFAPSVSRTCISQEKYKLSTT
ncbi:hypothetical protein HanXRQr2_Chr06g0244231 [Helianthus annuus]|uniref:Uncharacterized protein n=1 Tax=Helianthus annuus TaxID=4232 RepID=A0A9K3IQB7_HELAN|nr:hypothetical protein HanXRQr2_Chr06g0244231 [Helianthus annuus]